ncbi:Ribosome biogenesis protein NOP53 [Fulvia fulva]|nr:Ribosome biogenesis protein NOP53 [Fulvia fulva]
MADKVKTAPATHSQPSRKGKKAWRKNVDVSEVQDGLENVRDEIIKGGVISERVADQLFATDLEGDAEIEKTHKPKKLLKADDILAQRSAVPALSPGRKRKAEEVPVTTGKKQKNGKYVSHRELQRLRNVADGANIGIKIDDQAVHDVWGAPVEDETYKKLDFLEPPKQKREPKTLKHAPVPLTTSKKPLAHVRKPESGKSYMPDVHDWSDLFQREGAAAVEAEKARLAAEAAQAERERVAAEEGAKVEAAEKEEYATDYESAWESEWEGIQSEAEKESHTQKQKSRKTPSERNKVKARKEREAREKWEKKQKEKDIQEKRIREIAREVSAKDKLRRPGTELQKVDYSSDSDENDHQVELQKRRFGKLPIPEAPVEVTLPDDLTESLRRLKPEGNLLTDRYRNLLINGKLEVRKKVGQVKKKQTFRTEKWTYKDFTV